MHWVVLPVIPQEPSQTTKNIAALLAVYHQRILGYFWLTIKVGVTVKALHSNIHFGHTPKILTSANVVFISFYFLTTVGWQSGIVYYPCICWQDLQKIIQIYGCKKTDSNWFNMFFSYTEAYCWHLWPACLVARGCASWLLSIFSTWACSSS